jgi:PIN domain nuclease of toxin-antitoxin system
VKLLLDTHILLWWLSNDRELSRKAHELIAEPANTVFVSAVSMWEIWLKVSLGKLQVPDDFEHQLRDENFENLPLTSRHAREVAKLPWLHRDPFDRMLIAQSNAAGLTLLTGDEAVAAYGGSIVLAS